jgi:hypothetical protein
LLERRARPCRPRSTSRHAPAGRPRSTPSGDRRSGLIARRAPGYLDLRHRRAGPSHPVRSVCEHSNPRGRRRRRGRCRGRDPAERWRFSGGRDSETGSVRGTHVGGPRNAGVQGGTESSNLLCSSRQSVSAANAEAVREKPRTLAAFLWVAGDLRRDVQAPNRVSFALSL